MDNQHLKKLSKFMSLVLRHEPDRASLVLDEQGWVELHEFAAGLAREFAGAKVEDILEVVRSDQKGRYELTQGRIRAAQGHSVDVDTVGTAKVPPMLLFHGTTALAWKAIREHGAIVSMSRKHVHLSVDVATARSVARRRQGPHVILQIDSARMHSEGRAFYCAANGVWLTERVDAHYASAMSD